MELAIILFPLAMGGIALAVPSNRLRPLLLPAASLVHAACCLALVASPDLGGRVPWLFLDPVGKIALLAVAFLFLVCSFYTVSYLSYRAERSNRFFCACLLAFLGAISLAILSHHLGLTWVAVEAMTLMTAPLVYFNHSPRSIEATWKYLLVGSVGIALALLGTFFMAYSSLRGGMEASMGLDRLIEVAPSLSKPWFRASFILLLVGYGTKMGLAPMHTWKPDAYGEAPGVVGAVFSGGVTTGAFLALARAYQIGMAAGEGPFMCRILVAMGLLSMAVAGVFMIGQRDFKRMLAYSSVEHMGILVLGLGIGAPALYGTLLHVITNSMTKGVLFLSAGNIHRAYGAKTTDLVRGALSRVPASAALFLAGFLAITGSPPFGPFISEFSILNAAFSSGQVLPAALFLAFLLLVFIGMGITVLKVTQGSPPRDASPSRDASPPRDVASEAASDAATKGYREGLGTLAPLFAFMAIVLLLGLYIPAPLESLLREAAAYLGAS